MLRPPLNHFELCSSSHPDAYPIYGSHYLLKGGKSGMEYLLESLTIPDHTGLPDSIDTLRDETQSEIDEAKGEAEAFEEQLEEARADAQLLQRRIKELCGQLEDAGFTPCTPGNDSTLGECE